MQRNSIKRIMAKVSLGFLMYLNIFYLLTEFCVEYDNGTVLHEAKDIEIVNDIGHDVDLIFYCKDEKVTNYSICWPVNQKFWDYSTLVSEGTNKVLAVSLSRGQFITQVYKDYNYIGSIIYDTKYFEGIIELSQSNLKNTPKLKRIGNGSIVAIFFYSIVIAIYSINFYKVSNKTKLLLTIFIPVLLIDVFHISKIICFFYMY